MRYCFNLFWQYKLRVQLHYRLASTSDLSIIKIWLSQSPSSTILHWHLPFVPADMSCQSRRSWWHSVWGYRGGYFPALGRSGWRSARAWPRTTGPCSAAAQTCASDWATRRGTLCCAASRRDCRRVIRTPDRDGCGTWSDVLISLESEMYFIRPRINQFNSLMPGRSGCDFKNAKLNLYWLVSSDLPMILPSH